MKNDLNVEIGMAQGVMRQSGYYSGATAGDNPQESVFVDDLEKNVANARKLGIHSFVFENMEKEP